MSEKLEQAISFANYRQTLNNQLQKVKTKAEGLLILAKNGGSFNINRELISFVDYLSRLDIQEAVLLDVNDIPILITDIGEFQKEISRRYLSVTEDYYAEYQSIRKSRNVKSIIDLKDDE